MKTQVVLQVDYKCIGNFLEEKENKITNNIILLFALLAEL